MHALELLLAATQAAPKLLLAAAHERILGLAKAVRASWPQGGNCAVGAEARHAAGAAILLAQAARLKGTAPCCASLLMCAVVLAFQISCNGCIGGRRGISKDQVDSQIRQVFFGSENTCSACWLDPCLAQQPKRASPLGHLGNHQSWWCGSWLQTP